MAEISEMGEIINGMGDDGEIFGALDAIDVSKATAQEDAQAAWDTFAKNDKFGDIGEKMQDFKPDINKDGKIEFTNSEGKSFTADELKSAYTDGNYKDIFEKFGVNTSDPDVEEFLEKQKVDFEKEAGPRARAAAGDAEASGRRAEDAGAQEPQGKTPEEVEKSMREEMDRLGDKNVKKIEKAMEEMKKQIKEGKASEKNWGKWLKTGLTLVAEGFGLYELYQQVKKHQDAANGCWLVHNNGYKCKIRPLTCNSDSLNTDNGNFSICDYCKDQGKCTQDADPATFNPCVTGSGPKKDQEKATMPGKYDSTATDPNKACTVCSACAIQCSSGTCDSNCNCEKFNCPTNYKMTCVNMSFWGALSDLINETFDFADDLMMKILKILGLVLLVIVALVVIYFVVKFILSKISEHKSQ